MTNMQDINRTTREEHARGTANLELEEMKSIYPAAGGPGGGEHVCRQVVTVPVLCCAFAVLFQKVKLPELTRFEWGLVSGDGKPEARATRWLHARPEQKFARPAVASNFASNRRCARFVFESNIFEMFVRARRLLATLLATAGARDSMCAHARVTKVCAPGGC